MPIGFYPPDGKLGICSSYHYVTSGGVRALLPKRKQLLHKGTYGRCPLVAGAAVLAACVCCRLGAGLLTVHAPLLLENILQASIPEVLVMLG